MENSPEQEPLAHPAETREQTGSIYDLLLLADERALAGRKPFEDEEAALIMLECFLAPARKWADKAGRRDGKQRIAREAAEDGGEPADTGFARLSSWLEDRRVADNVHLCWAWLLGHTKKTGLPPWRTILANVVRRPLELREEQAHRQIRTGANRRLGRELRRGEARQTLRVSLSKLLGKSCVKRPDPKAPKTCHYHPPGKEAFLPDDGLDLVRLAERLGRRDPSGGKHTVTSAVLPPPAKLRPFLADAFAAARCALSLRQLFDLCVTVFNLDLRDPLRLDVQPEPVSDEAFTQGTLAVSAAAEVEPLFWKQKVYDAGGEREPFSMIKGFAQRLVAELERADGVEAAVPVKERGRKADWLAPLYLRFCLWLDWPLWDEDSRQPILGDSGIPLGYGYEAAAAHLGKARATVQETVCGGKAGPGRFLSLLRRELSEEGQLLPAVEIERVEDLLRCRYFHFKPPFVDPGHFDPKTVLEYLR